MQLKKIYIGWIVGWLLVPSILQYLVMYHVTQQVSMSTYVWTVDIILMVSVGIAIARKKAITHMQFLANYDSVTGLPNRNLLHERLNQALSYRKRNGDAGGIAVLFIDLDNFKHINDSLGHHIGDALLKHFGTCLAGCVRATDTVSRTGGDEFVIILTKVDSESDVEHFVKKIFICLAKPILVETHELFVSASVGIAMSPDDGTDQTTLLKHADIAMYRAKRAGKGQHQFYNTTMNGRARELLAMENELHYAVEKNEFELYYQPQISTKTGKIVGVEALLRWEHSVYGSMSPAEFIPVIENVGLIIPIGEWVIREACTQAAAWHKQGFYISMSINLSVKQIEDPGFAEMVNEIINTTGADPKWLVFELTETVLASRPEVIHIVFQSLKARGVSLSIDDFGTGYSSLNYLVKLPIDSIKIDQSFVKNILENEGTCAIVKAVVALAHSLKMTVVAEGVETKNQYGLLRSINCDEVQGYLFSRPIPSVDMTQLLVMDNAPQKRRASRKLPMKTYSQERIK